MKYPVIFILILVLFGCAGSQIESQKTNLLTEERILAASNWIDEYTIKRDFEKASKYYFDGTQFFQYQKYNGEEVVTSQLFSEAKQTLQITFKMKGLKIVESEVIDQDVKLHENNEGTVFKVFKRLTAYKGIAMKSTDSIGRVFGIKNGRLVVLQEHMKSKL